MEDNLTETIDYHRFKASYHKLAANAYNNSLGHWANSEDNRVLTNKEMKNLPENYFVTELGMAGLNYDSFNVDEAKKTMMTSLNSIASETSTNTTLLKKVIELALYNESLYGINDLAKLDNVISRKTLRERRYFDLAIERAATNTQIINDDRTL